MRLCDFIPGIVLISMLCSACGNSEVTRGVRAIVDHQADPRPYAGKFKSHFDETREAFVREKRSWDNASKILAWIFYEWGAFDDAWVFIQLGQPADPWDSEIGTRLIWLLGKYELEPTDTPQIRDEKKRARGLVEKAKSDQLPLLEVRKLFRVKDLKHLAAYTVACRQGISAESARHIIAVTQHTLFTSYDISSWNDVAQNPATPSELVSDCAVIFRVLEKTGHQDMLPRIKQPDGERRLSSEMLGGIITKIHGAAGLTAYHQQMLQAANRP